jgi:hypothetical protein
MAHRWTRGAAIAKIDVQELMEFFYSENDGQSLLYLSHIKPLTRRDFLCLFLMNY